VKKELLTFWNSVSFFVTYANIAGFEPGVGGGNEKPLDRWLAARTAQLVRDATDAYERYWTPDVTAAFAPSPTICPTGTSAGPAGASGTTTRRRSRRSGMRSRRAAVIAPVMPFLAEHLWRNLVSEDESGLSWRAGRTRSSSMRRFWPRWGGARGRHARPPGARRFPAQAPAAAAPARRPGRFAGRFAPGRDPDELRVKEVEFGEVEATELRVKPNLPILGPKLGKELGAVRAALEAGEFEQLADGRFRAAGHELQPEEVLVERRGGRAGRSPRRTG
jgi:isoleucyl-tRNA synthetase